MKFLVFRSLRPNAQSTCPFISVPSYPLVQFSMCRPMLICDHCAKYGLQPSLVAWISNIGYCNKDFVLLVALKIILVYAQHSVARKVSR